MPRVDAHAVKEPSAAERDMISEGNPNTCDRVCDACQHQSGGNEVSGPSESPILSQQQVAHHSSSMIIRPIKRMDPSGIHDAVMDQEKRSGVQWGRQRGVAEATWEEALGLAFLRCSAETTLLASSPHTHGVRGGSVRKGPRTADSAEEWPNANGDAEGRSP